MIEIFIIKVIKENIKKGKYYTIDNKVISQNICIEDYFDNFGLEIRIHTDEDSLDNTIQIKHNGILIKELGLTYLINHPTDHFFLFRKFGK